MGKGHPPGDRARASPTSPTQPYLGPQAQLVDGVFGLRILGEELVVVLLQGRDNEVVTARPHREPTPKGASGRLRLPCNETPVAQF